MKTTFTIHLPENLTADDVGDVGFEELDLNGWWSIGQGGFNDVAIIICVKDKPSEIISQEMIQDVLASLNEVTRQFVGHIDFVDPGKN